MPQIRIFPEQASTLAPQVDALYFFLIALTAFFTLLISAMVVYFAVKYRRTSSDQVGVPIHGNLTLEMTWTIIPLIIVLFIFGWSARLFYTIARPPAQTLDVYVVGKQWMWKFQHPDGRAEVNELHVPVGTSVKLTMTSQDVIHDVYIPDFRVKADVLPGVYTHLWFKATTPGRYRLFCAEYCGTNHSGMVGWVIVQERAEYEQWLAGGGAQGSMAQMGEKVFKDLACSTCHLVGLYGKAVTLADGSSVEADVAYIRESILNPRAKIVSGFQPLMPTFQGLVNEDAMLQLIEYIKSLKSAPPTATGVTPVAASPVGTAAPARKK
jgi:cytochrome c oxidase subunit 2